MEIKPRQIEIYNIELQEAEKENNIIKFRVHCSKGTYIRSLCEDIAEKLQTVGYMKELNRIKVGKFDIEYAITLEELEEKEMLKDKIITIEEFFKDLPTIELDETKLNKFLNGMILKTDNEDGLYNIYEKDYIGIGIVNNKKLKRDIII